MAKNETSVKLKLIGGKQVKDELGGVSDGAQKVSTSMPKAGQSMADTAAKAAMMAAGALAAVKALQAMTQALADSRNELADTSTRTGLAVETLAGLRLAAEGSGQKLGSLASGLEQLPKRMADVARGTGEAKVAFEALDVSAVDSAGNLRSADEVLRELVTKMNQVADPTERASLATQAFGRSGGALMQALSGTDLEHFTGLAKEYGVSLAPQAMKASADWEREVANLGLVFDGLKDSIMSAMSGEGGATGILSDVTAGFVFLGTIARGVAEMVGKVWRNALIPIQAGFEAAAGNVTGAQKIMEDFDPMLMFGAGILELDGLLAEATSSMEKFRLASAKTKGGAPGGATGGAAGGRPGIPATPAAAPASAADSAIAKTVDTTGQLIQAFEALNKGFEEGAKAAKVAAGTFDEELTQTEKLRKVQSDLLFNWQQLQEAAVQIGVDGSASFRMMSDQMRTEIDRIDKAIKESATLEKTEKAAGAAGAVVGGAMDPTSMLGMAGPWGAVIAGVMSIGEDFKEFFRGVFDGVLLTVVNIFRDLPIILTELIPRFVITLVGALIEGVFEIVPKLVTALVTRLPVVIVEGVHQAFLRAWAAIKTFFTNLFSFKGKKGKNAGQKIANTFSDILTLGQGRKIHEFHSGGFVPNDGQFLLRQGERVTPPTGANTQTAGLAAFAGGGANVTINTAVVDPNTIDSLGTMIDRHFGSFGKNSLPVFGG